MKNHAKSGVYTHDKSWFDCVCASPGFVSRLRYRPLCPLLLKIGTGNNPALWTPALKAQKWRCSHVDEGIVVHCEMRRSRCKKVALKQFAMFQDALRGSRDSGPQCDDPVGRVEAKTEKGRRQSRTLSI